MSFELVRFPKFNIQNSTFKTPEPQLVVSLHTPEPDRSATTRDDVSLELPSKKYNETYLSRTELEHLLREKDVPALQINKVLDAYEPAANRIANTVAVSFVQERERVIRQQQEAIRELSTPVLQVRERLLILPMIVYHVGQLLVDTIIVDRWRQAKLAEGNAATGVRSSDKPGPESIEQIAGD